jgi:transposase-like protein
MPLNKIQFQKGLAFKDFLGLYGSEEKCQAALAVARWPKGFSCPQCGHFGHCIVYHGKCMTYQCNHCHAQTTLTSGTIFQGTRLPLSTWFFAMYLITQSKNNVSALELTRILGICYRSAWRLKHKLIQVMYERENSRVLEDRVEIDDAYLGGERRGGKTGRGSENKIPFLAAVQTDMAGHPIYAVFSRLKTFSSNEIEQWASARLKAKSIVVSDGLACFAAVRNAGCYHMQEVVGKDKKSTDMGCFNWVNTILGNLKTAIHGTYHSFDFEKYAHRYLAEVQYRFNRRFTMESMLVRLLFAGVQTSARPETWLRLAES